MESFNIFFCFLEKIIKLKDLSKWRKLKNKFLCRCVPVAIIKYLKLSANLATMFNFIYSMMVNLKRKEHQELV